MAKFEKGMIPWNKDKKLSETHRQNLSISHQGERPWMKGVEIEKNKGANNYNWKGDKVGYIAMHQWVMRRKGRASEHKCEHCSKQAQDWSNKDHKYKRDIDDYRSLCKSCHRKYDYKNNLKHDNKIGNNQFNN